MRLVLFVSLIIALAAVVFAMQNPGQMNLNIPFTDSQLVSTQPVVLISTLLIGLVIGLLASLPGRISAGLRARRAEKRLEEIGKGGVPTAPARVEASESHMEALPTVSTEDATETQRLADEVARRAVEAQQSRPPPLSE